MSAAFIGNSICIQKNSSAVMLGYDAEIKQTNHDSLTLHERMLHTAKEKSDSPAYQRENGGLVYFALRPELVGRLSAFMHRNDKALMIILAFQRENSIASKSGLLVLSMTASTYGLAHSSSPYRPHKAHH